MNDLLFFKNIYCDPLLCGLPDKDSVCFDSQTDLTPILLYGQSMLFTQSILFSRRLLSSPLMFMSRGPPEDYALRTADTPLWARLILGNPPSSHPDYLPKPAAMEQKIWPTRRPGAIHLPNPKVYDTTLPILPTQPCPSACIHTKHGH